MSTTSFPWLYFLSNRFWIVCLHFSFTRGATKCIDEMTAFVTPINTPVKKVLVADGLKIDSFCRVCNINVKISGRGRYNLFGGKRSKEERVVARLSFVLSAPVVEEKNVSSISCFKCRRNMKKLE